MRDFQPGKLTETVHNLHLPVETVSLALRNR